jgi:hypothetical protein
VITDNKRKTNMSDGNMNKSESIKELASALSKAQGKIKGAVKDSANPFFKSKYADLASVVEAIREAFSANGLSYIQQVSESEKDEVRVETVLMHSSGEWINCGILALPVSKADAQGYGSALTYARRYSLSAAVGVAPEDDDGNAATKAKPEKKEPEEKKNGNYRPAYNVLGFNPRPAADTPLEPEDKKQVEDVVEKALKWLAQGKVADAVLEIDNAGFHSDQWLYVNSFFDSTQRRLMKAEAARLKEEFTKKDLATQA